MNLRPFTVDFILDENTVLTKKRKKQSFVMCFFLGRVRVFFTDTSVCGCVNIEQATDNGKREETQDK